MASASLRRCGLWSLSLAALVGCEPQDRVQPDTSATLILRPITTANDEELDLAMPDAGILLDSGQFAFAVDAISGLVRITDSVGNPVRLIGRRGQGPGEYHGVSWLLPADGGLLIGTTDGRTLRFSSDGEFLGQSPFGVRVSGYITRVAGDTIVVAQPTPVLGQGFKPFHVLTLSGDTLGVFGAEGGSEDAKTLIQLYRTITPASDSTFWAVHPFTYLIEQWTTRGSLIHAVQVQRDGFPTGAEGKTVLELMDEYRPAPRVRAVRQRADGTLLVMIERQKPDLPPRPTGAPSGEVPARLAARMEDRDQVLEVVDPRTGRMLRSVVNSGPVYLMGILSDDLVWGVVADADGREQPNVYQLESGM